MTRGYETPEDYTSSSDDHEAREVWEGRAADGDREEAALRRWESRREEGPAWDAPEPGETPGEYREWLRREEYGDEDAPDMEEAA